MVVCGRTGVAALRLEEFEDRYWYCCGGGWIGGAGERVGGERVGGGCCCVGRVSAEGVIGFAGHGVGRCGFQELADSIHFCFYERLGCMVMSGRSLWWWSLLL